MSDDANAYRQSFCRRGQPESGFIRFSTAAAANRKPPAPFRTAHIRHSLGTFWHREGNSNSWLLVCLKGTASNAAGIGAKVRLRARIDGQDRWQLRQISGGFADDLRAHFGLGDATVVDNLRIAWPSGIVQELTNVEPNQILTVTEPPRLIPQAAGGFQIQCWINQSFDVEVSEDLENWSVVDTVTNETGELVWQDGEPSEQICRYYRVVAK